MSLQIRSSAASLTAAALLLALGACRSGTEVSEVEREEPERRTSAGEARFGEPRTAGFQRERRPGAAIDAELANHRAEPEAALSFREGGLEQAFAVQTEHPVSHRPLVEAGRVYFGDWGGNVYAVELATGRVLWRQEVGEPRREWPWHGVVGTGALGEELLFEATAEGEAVALDKRTGEPRWTKRFVDEGQEAGNVGDVLVHDGLVYIGVASIEEALAAQEEGFEPDFRGRVVALRAEDGEMVWERELAEPPATGVAVWSGFALDPASGALFVTTSNNYRPPATRWSDAVLALDARSGDVRWAYQATQNDVWTMAERLGPDYAFGAGPQLFEAPDGEDRTRLLVGAGQKDGMYHALDAATGEKVWETSIGYGGFGGGIMGEGAVGEARIFVLSNNRFDPMQPLAGQEANVKAIDARDGSYVWVRNGAQPAASHGGDLLAGEHFLTGSCDGRVRAYRAEDGELVWTSPRHAGVASALAAADGKVLFGTGLPAAFGGAEGPVGLFAYGAPDAGRPVEAGFPRETASAARRIEITAIDFEYRPNRITAAPGEELVIELVNRGTMPHDIEFELPTGELELEEPLHPGASGTLRFRAPKEPGEYEIYCPVEQHRERGMVGTLVVEER